MNKLKKPLNDRAESLLRALITQYIAQGQPIGSKTLAHSGLIGLSPASIRNVLADLEELGFIKSPHTSAGRVPTIQGYRYFVDSLMTVRPLEDTLVRALASTLREEKDTQSLVIRASDFLSKLTDFTGIVTLPRRRRLALQQVEFLPLSDLRVLVILVTNKSEVQNRIIRVPRAYKSEELERAANYLNNKFAGREITQVRDEIMREMEQARESMDLMMRSLMVMANQMFGQAVDDSAEDCVVSGQTNLMSHDELANVDKLKQLFDAFNQKRDILQLLDQSLSAEGVQIFIGEEAGYKALGDCSVVATRYSVDGKVLGTLGVIGPTRMPYDQVISIVDITAKLLGSVLNSK